MSHENTIAELEQYVARAQRVLDEVDHEHPLSELRELPPAMREEVAAEKMDAWAGLDAAKTKLAAARAEFAASTREENDAAARRTVDANERMAAASETAAKASADAARLAKWAAIFTALAALATLVTTWLQVRG